MTYSIVPIVEGHSEIESVPVLMRRLRDKWGKYELEIERPVRVHRNQVVKPDELERRVILATTRPNCRAIMVILDADDDCPKELAPKLLERAGRVVQAQGIIISVVLANSELEAWFISSIESLHGIRGISTDAQSPNNPEEKRDAKKFLSNLMGERYYSEVDDQPAFASRFDLTKAYMNSRSFKKFQDDFYKIVLELVP
ncbi:MAG: DUF4276 family protein [Chloroflexi bacterium]|nr:DUF4276 family protein [Chloroflexota bacterium]